MKNDPQELFIESARNLQKRLGGAIAPPLRQMPCAESSARQQRALNTCHRYALAEPARKPSPRDSRAYVPELSARIEDDPNLTDGARRCARKLAELTYRKSRDTRSLPVTVTYLARCLGRCRRTVQRYLRQLEREGYVAVQVVASHRSRLCIGLIVRLCAPLLAAHHRDRWPGNPANPGATPESQIKRFKGYSEVKTYQLSVEHWALRCMDGVFRSFMKTDPLKNLSISPTA
jgi:hypothetical protein